MICNEYGLEINEWAEAQFSASYNKDYESELQPIVKQIFERIEATPKRLLTYSQLLTKGKQNTSPHNFLLCNDKTLSIRTTKTSDRVAPRTTGQAGLQVLNDYFSDIYGDAITNQQDIKKLVFYHIHEILPVFIDHLFQSDYTVFLSKNNLKDYQIISSEDIAYYSFNRDEFSFTRDLSDWVESTTLRYYGTSIAEIQVHKNRTFKFRFFISKMPIWLKKVKETNETLGMSAEYAICEHFKLKRPENLNYRVLRAYVNQLMPVVGEAFRDLPDAVTYSGSNIGERGAQSKCSYDFILKGNKTLSLKTNKGNMVCPPEVGQPGAETCYQYFGNYINGSAVTDVTFKEMVLNHIAEIMPIYVSHLFDSDYLLWIRQNDGGYQYKIYDSSFAKNVVWKPECFEFTKPSLATWNESTTVKYLGVTIGEFQVHKNRACYKFRFDLEKFDNLIKSRQLNIEPIP